MTIILNKPTFSKSQNLFEANLDRLTEIEQSACPFDNAIVQERVNGFRLPICWVFKFSKTEPQDDNVFTAELPNGSKLYGTIESPL